MYLFEALKQQSQKLVMKLLYKHILQSRDWGDLQWLFKCATDEYLETQNVSKEIE